MKANIVNMQNKKAVSSRDRTYNLLHLGQRANLVRTVNIWCLTINLGGVGHCYAWQVWVPHFIYFIYIHTYIYSCIFQQFTLLCTDMKWVTLALNPPHSLNNYTDFLLYILIGLSMCLDLRVFHTFIFIFIAWILIQ